MGFAGTARLARAIGCAFVIALGLAAAPASASLLDNLEGYWAFENSGADGSGNGRAVTLQGGATYGAGRLGQGLLLDGAQGSGASRILDDAVFDFAGDFAIQVWVNPDETSREQTLIEKFIGGGGPTWTLTFLGGQFYVSGTGAVINTGTGFTAGAWHQVIVSRSGGTISVYYDGAAGPTGGLAGALPDTTAPLLIGARNASDGRNFTLDGTIDEVAIWSRALSEAEIGSLWNGGAGRALAAVPEPGALPLLAGALAGLALLRRRRHGAAA
jgi:hypothetical protein